MNEASRFRINILKVIHETLEGETVLINLDSGNYYSLGGIGVDIWGLIEGGANEDAIVEWVACRYKGEIEEIEKAIQRLLSDLQYEDLVIIDGKEAYESVIEHSGYDKVNSCGQMKNFIPPVLQKYTDMQKLLLRDPIHDVDESGWPSSKDKFSSRQGLFYFCDHRNRKTIKMTGIDNCHSRVRYYPSFHHFIYDIPCSHNIRNFDYLVTQNFLHNEFLLFQKPKVFFATEPPPGLTEETRKNIQLKALKPFLYLYTEPSINKRMFYPALPSRKERIIGDLEKSLTEERTRFCCIINRYSEQLELDLLQQRVDYVKIFGKNIDIFGLEPWSGPNKWPSFPNYYGMTENKQETLRKYNFTLTFENSDFDGYITEKIIHAFMAGTVPLYLGGGDFLKETFPSSCYIDCRNRKPEEVLQMITNMTLEEIVSFRKAAIEFLKSDDADRFTSRYLREEIVKRLEVMRQNDSSHGD